MGGKKVEGRKSVILSRMGKKGLAEKGIIQIKT